MKDWRRVLLLSRVETNCAHLVCGSSSPFSSQDPKSRNESIRAQALKTHFGCVREKNSAETWGCFDPLWMWQGHLDYVHDVIQKKSMNNFQRCNMSAPRNTSKRTHNRCFRNKVYRSTISTPEDPAGYRYCICWGVKICFPFFSNELLGASSCIAMNPVR